jgi:hypothetical protein
VPPNFIEQEFLSASASGRSVLAAVWAPMMTLDLSSALLEVDHGGCGVWRREAPVLEPVASRPLAPLLNLTQSLRQHPGLIMMRLRQQLTTRGPLPLLVAMATPPLIVISCSCLF